jgi:hypothetical protein
VRCTIGSRKMPGEMKPVIIDDDDDDEEEEEEEEEGKAPVLN